MKQKRRKLVAFLAMFIVLLTSSQLGIAKEWDFEPIDDVNKAWEIKFNIPLDGSSLTTDSVYILDGKGKHPVTLQLTGNGNTVQVSPKVPYEVGKQYMLMITGAVRANEGKALKTSVEVPFRVVNPTEKIIAVQSLTSGYLTTLTVTGSPDVHKVKVGTEEMRYKGNNRYQATLFDAKPGSTVTIYAYDESGKSLGTKQHKYE
ncbi:Ig-like domain-containing protein [Sporosarcina sp. FSL K6-6792]|uniref:Ig-like domain-containing protein n=1 Tax=Sporosarcina sp. FSL K6-6792 TaxID=2921559 RepID=UPI0030F6C428